VYADIDSQTGKFPLVLISAALLRGGPRRVWTVAFGRLCKWVMVRQMPARLELGATEGWETNTSS
jgi:hypothetical protein